MTHLVISLNIPEACVLICSMVCCTAIICAALYKSKTLGEIQSKPLEHLARGVESL